MTIRDDFLPVLDEARGLLDTEFGLRRYDVAMVVTTWPAGTLPGGGADEPEHVVTPITVAGDARPKVEQLSQKDILASGGLYQDQDVRVGPLTPIFAGGGISVEAFEPAPTGDSNVQILFRLIGPGTPAEGALYRKVGQTVTRSFSYTIVLRRVGASDA